MDVAQQFVRIEDIMDACDCLKWEWEQRKAHFSGGAKALETDAKQVGEALTRDVDASVRHLRITILDAYDWGIEPESALACIQQLLPSGCLEYAERKIKTGIALPGKE